MKTLRTCSTDIYKPVSSHGPSTRISFLLHLVMTPVCSAPSCLLTKDHAEEGAKTSDMLVLACELAKDFQNWNRTWTCTERMSRALVTAPNPA